MPTAKRNVRDIMTKVTITVDRNTRLVKAVRLMDRDRVGALPIVNSLSEICGIITHSDLVGLTYELQCGVSVLPHVSDVVRRTLINVLAEDYEDFPVSDAMTSDVTTIDPDASVREAAQVLIDNHIHHLPVVDEHKVPIGIISSYDIVRAVAED